MAIDFIGHTCSLRGLNCWINSTIMQWHGRGETRLKSWEKSFIEITIKLHGNYLKGRPNNTDLIQIGVYFGERSREDARFKIWIILSARSLNCTQMMLCFFYFCRVLNVFNVSNFSSVFIMRNVSANVTQNSILVTFLRRLLFKIDGQSNVVKL